MTEVLLRLASLLPGVTFLRIRRYDATRMRAAVRSFTAYDDVPRLDRGFILQNLRHMEALRILAPAKALTPA